MLYWEKDFVHYENHTKVCNCVGQNADCCFVTNIMRKTKIRYFG